MMKNIDKYQIENGKFKSWLLKIAVNTTKDYFRSKIYKQRIQSYDIDNHEIEDKANVVDILSKKEETIKIKEAIKNLPKLQREAIILKYYNDLKIKEISNITGENENTIKSRLFNGVKNLKNYLEVITMKNKTSSKINNIRYDDINDYEFENLLEEDLLDIENFLDSYVVKKVDEEKIDLTIETLRNYMPKKFK
ncbi:RNA polymerase sigma factor, sigma-70 family protein [[Clostridium] sordellii ATCC 9714]|nr:RNA polymerase sigma factor, sigma-70 family protein [[Clostridium] sordellii ATCC 9714] [Paeniclostridium sordellii ATCC 9714]